MNMDQTKIYINQNMISYAMYHVSSYDPTFGNDICIKSDTNINSGSYSIIGKVYELPPGQTDTFLVGSRKFQVAEIDVFHII